MNMNGAQLHEIILYWTELAQYDIETAQVMYDGKRYPYALYMCHTALEKILKALVVQATDAHADYTHNIVSLSESLPHIPFTAEQSTLMAEVNGFNMKARYPEWERLFYKKATAEFTKQYMDKVNEIYIWLQKFLQK